MAELAEETCSLSYSLIILIVVLATNALKAIVMASMAISHNQQSLLTLGDAITSFLTTPDSTTVGRCLWSSKDFVPHRLRETPKPKPFKPQRDHLASVPSSTR
jgi:hypothetical protein